MEPSQAPLLGARRIRELLDLHGVRLTKSLGQNFVIDPNTIRKMLTTASIREDDHVLEIGAGAGSLTMGLAGVARKVTAIEVDERLAPILEETVGELNNVEIILADALNAPLPGFAADVVVANLPYNIAATVVIDVLERCDSVRALTVMTQREVGERLAAGPGSKIYGRTSVLVAFDAAARSAGSVSRRAFFPVPNVDSSIVRLDRRPAPEVQRGVFKEVVDAAFTQRRKTLRNTLAGVAGSTIAAEEILEAAGVDPGARAEQLGIEEFVSIARTISASGR